MKILISAGPTREWIDPVRYISNPATGRLGYLLAEEAVRRGHEAVLVCGPTGLENPAGVKVVRVETARQMETALRRHFPDCQALFMTAAVGDWRPRFRRTKLKCKRKFSLTLFPNPDILAGCGRLKKNGQTLIGCALETNNLVEAGRAKLRRKNLDFILVNEPGFFGKEKGRHQSFLLSRRGEVYDLSNRSKEDISRFLYDRCLLTCSNPS